MNVKLGVPRALVMEHIADIWNIETSSRYIGTNQNSASVDSGFNFIDTSLELFEILESLSLLHLGMEAIIFNLEEIQQTVKTTGGSNSITEDNNGLTSLLLEVVIQVEVLLILATTNNHLGKRSWHSTFVLLLGQINDLGVL